MTTKAVRCTVDEVPGGRSHVDWPTRDAHSGDMVRRRARDTLLNAQGGQKLICLGTTWTGNLQPEIDRRIDEIGALVTGFTSGQTLHAEPVGKVVNVRPVLDALK